MTDVEFGESSALEVLPEEAVQPAQAEPYRWVRRCFIVGRHLQPLRPC